ncbi:glycoside hydrolase family 32 protein [Acinetobacter boissieri]|uniref:Sucrose-6-phosphate hydrolase n=1 Tax=Acinetobacter boissieri TaxID=1219383 RepID=A0A1G6HCU5_9GAMM|nr:sucrose-6-phosphate hydrolase [Acinetobacter boissieri]SDB92102.1 beta-fructofuranosidase [Acinetobacter boissieri]
MMKEIQLLKQTLHAVMNNYSTDSNDRYRPTWHLSPVAGLLNDPNGFIQFNGQYHLFYQWNPLACDHSNKFWGHWSSSDLVHWKHEPVALLPTENFDIDGCFSGSAVNDDGQLVLIYTGNVMLGETEADRTAWQCIARQGEDGEFKKQAVIGQLEGYTGHIRDPKVWKENGLWYMVLAAQDLKLQGKVLLLESPDLENWTLKGEIAGSDFKKTGPFGYMWECPDLFRLDGHDVLISCPQGVAPEERRYLSMYQCGYLLGQLDYSTADYPHSAFLELDHGHEFYAPQTTLAEDGRRLLVGWMGVPDQDEFSQPTLEFGWIHMMSCPRELRIKDGLLYQLPVKELQSLRREHQHVTGTADTLPTFKASSAELIISNTGSFEINISNTLWLICDSTGITLTRKSLSSDVNEVRYWDQTVNKLQILLDRSSVEIFVNDGLGTLTSRYFSQDEEPVLKFSGSAALDVDYWTLEAAPLV